MHGSRSTMCCATCHGVRLAGLNQSIRWPFASLARGGRGFFRGGHGRCFLPQTEEWRLPRRLCGEIVSVNFSVHSRLLLACRQLGLLRSIPLEGMINLCLAIGRAHPSYIGKVVRPRERSHASGCPRANHEMSTCHLAYLPMRCRIGILT